MTLTHLPDTAPIVTHDPSFNVITALAKVMADLPGIGKDSQSPQGYAYRGIEQVTKEAQRLFAKHGVVIAPHRVKWYPPREITVNNKPWTDERCKVTYRIYGPGGAHDYIEVTTVGIGRDNSDKGSNKALTQAYKYALLEALMIADAKDDLEERHEAEKPVPDGWSSWEECDEAHNDLRNAVKEAPDDVRRKWNGYKRDSGYPAPFTKAQYDELAAQLEIILGDGAQRVAPEAGDREAPEGTAPVSVPTSGVTPLGDETVSQPVPPSDDSMVSGENPEPGRSGPHETLSSDAGPEVLPLLVDSATSGPRVDPKEWLKGRSPEAKAKYDAWRRENRVPATLTAWGPQHQALFDAWVLA